MFTSIKWNKPSPHVFGSEYNAIESIENQLRKKALPILLMKAKGLDMMISLGMSGLLKEFQAIMGDSGAGSFIIKFLIDKKQQLLDKCPLEE